MNGQAPVITQAYVIAVAQQLLARAHSQQQAQQWAWWLLHKATGKTAIELLVHAYTLSKKQQRMLQQWVRQIRDTHQPISYILGTLPFGSLEIIVEPPILIPRPETEFWVNQLSHEYRQTIHRPLQILEIGTGTGCIALMLATQNEADVTAVDINPDAIKLAQKNAAQNAIDSVRFLQSDLFQAISANNQYDCLVSNPPYIAEQQYHTLEQSVRDWEDPRALISPQKGLAHIQQIITQAPAYLRCRCTYPDIPAKQLCIEIDQTQTDAVVQLFQKHHYAEVTVLQDQYQRDRVVCASKGCLCSDQTKNRLPVS